MYILKDSLRELVGNSVSRQRVTSSQLLTTKERNLLNFEARISSKRDRVQYIHVFQRIFFLEILLTVFYSYCYLLCMQSFTAHVLADGD